MEKPIELNEAETTAVAGGLFNDITVFVVTDPVNNSFNTASFNSNAFNTSASNNNSNNTIDSWNNWLSF